MDRRRDEELVPIPGRPPSLINLPGGCSFHPRCPYVREAHKRVDPVLDAVDGDPTHQVALPARLEHAQAPVGASCSPGSRRTRPRQDVIEEGAA